jgi:hypothetical protein
MILKTPQILIKPSQVFIDDLQQNISGKIFAKKQSYINAANATNLPASVLMTIAAIENSGEHFKNGSVDISGSEKSVGVMQISPESFFEHLRAEKLSNRVSAYSLAQIKAKIPNLDLTPRSASKKDFNAILEALKDYDFNILASAIVFRRLLEQTADRDVMRLDRAIVKYNVGEYSKPTKTIAFNYGDTTNLYNNASLPKITKNYIVKAVGVNGGLDFFTKKGY